jgi:predicted DNA-binding protein
MSDASTLPKKMPYTLDEIKLNYSKDWPLTVKNIEAIAGCLEDIMLSDNTTKRIVEGVYKSWGAEHTGAAHEELAAFGEQRADCAIENLEDFYYCSYNIVSFYGRIKNEAFLELANEAHTVGPLVVEIVKAIHNGTYTGELERELSINTYIQQNLSTNFDEYS